MVWVEYEGETYSCFVNSVIDFKWLQTMKPKNLIKIRIDENNTLLVPALELKLKEEELTRRELIYGKTEATTKTETRFVG